MREAGRAQPVVRWILCGTAHIGTCSGQYKTFLTTALESHTDLIKQQYPSLQACALWHTRTHSRKHIRVRTTRARTELSSSCAESTLGLDRVQPRDIGRFVSGTPKRRNGAPTGRGWSHCSGNSRQWAIIARRPAKQENRRGNCDLSTRRGWLARMVTRRTNIASPTDGSRDRPGVGGWGFGLG